MYAKLVLRNVRRSAKDYLIYIVTMTICVMLFYGFLSITSDYYKADVGIEFDLTILSDGMKLAISAITLLLLFLIRYVNNFMLNRRQKEYAIQMIMGMEQRTTAKLFFAETFIMGLISIGIGLILGMAGSQFVTAMLLSYYEQPFHLTWTLFPDTVLLTVSFFAGVFSLIGLSNVRTIRKTKIIDMLNAEKQNESEITHSRYMKAVTAAYGMAILYMLVTGISKIYYYFDIRLPFPVHIMFYGNIIIPCFTLLLLVIWYFRRKKRRLCGLLWGLFFCSVTAACFAAIVPALRLKYYLAMDSGTVNQYLMFLIIDLIFSICAFIYLAHDIICMVKERFPEYRYRDENLFLFGQIMSKIKTTAKTTTLICLTLTFAICLFMIAPALIGWASGYLEARSVYDIQIFSSYNQVVEVSDLPEEDYQPVTAYMAKNDIKTLYDLTFSLYLPKTTDFHKRVKYEFPAAAISLTDYNQILIMRGYAPISLEDNEFTTQWQSIAPEEERTEFLSQNPSIATDGGSLQLSSKAEYQYELGETLYNSYTDVTFVFPDTICEKLLPVMRNRYIMTSKPLSVHHAQELETLFSQAYPEDKNVVTYGIRTSTQQINSTKASNFILQTSMTYGALVLLIICFTILSIQQLADTVHYRHRFGVLLKMGVEEAHINRLIFRQLSVWFGLPVVVAAFVSFIIITYFFTMISAQICAYIGASVLLAQVGGVILILIILLICYFVSTWILFKRAATPI